MHTHTHTYTTHTLVSSPEQLIERGCKALPQHHTLCATHKVAVHVQLCQVAGVGLVEEARRAQGSGLQRVIVMHTCVCAWKCMPRCVEYVWAYECAIGVYFTLGVKLAFMNHERCKLALLM